MDVSKLIQTKKELKAITGIHLVEANLPFPSPFDNNRIAFCLTNILANAYNYKIKEIASLCNVDWKIATLWYRGDPRVYMEEEQMNILLSLIEKERKKYIESLDLEK